MMSGKDLSTDIAALRSLVSGASGTMNSGLRGDAVSGAPLPPALAAFSAKVRKASASVSDGDVQALLQSGLSEDAVFELVVCSAVGSGLERLQAGLRALRSKA